MKCLKCNNDFIEEFSYCPYCGTSSSLQERNNIINAGTNNVNIGIGNNSKQEIHLNIQEKEEKVVKYENKLDGEIIGGKKGYKYRLQISSILSVVSAVVTIVGYIYNKSNYIALFVMITVGLIIYAIDSLWKFTELKKNGIVYKNNNPILYEENETVYRVRKYGICPVCQGRVNIHYDKQINRALGKCVNNPEDHLFTYDHTIDAGFPFTYIKFYENK
ncbi:hypothetical protein [Lysinibacillus sp. OF-1]|uniref:hypothetical protein n=1 Tax=unclassified Lysinibacillus TaxID=2636778 RepID=UPI00232FA326|nr:hypothetical protein [Lysinibacillus sp. OF-1]WCH47810.1 hypothetical protein NV349_22975 [Lysinibacillus sp. OF-1]